MAATGDAFPPGSVIRRVNIEPAIMLGAGRALLLQLAHPAVAQGVEDHSDFKANPFKRLQGTLEATYAVVFGTRDLAERVGARIRWIHDFVSGPDYRANDPANLLWVHATLLDTALRCYTTYVEPLPPADEAVYYEQMCEVAELFGCPRQAQPATLADFRAYFDETVRAIEVTDVGRDLSSFILDPELPLNLHVPFKPLLGLQRRLTLASLPTAVREQLGATWTSGDQARAEAAERRIRAVMARTPRAIRTAGNRAGGQVLIRQATRHVRRWEAKVAGSSGDARAA